MTGNWLLHANEYKKGNQCDKSITGKRLNVEIDMDKCPEVDSIGVSGGRIELNIKNVTETLELHVWGYRIDITVYCDENVDIPVHIHSTSRTVEELPDDKKKKILDIEQPGYTKKNEKKIIEKIKDSYTEEVEKEATRRINVLIFNGQADQSNIPDGSNRININSTRI